MWFKSESEKRRQHTTDQQERKEAKERSEPERAAVPGEPGQTMITQEEYERLRAIIPPPVPTFTCGVCYLYCEGKGQPLEGLEVCGYCTYHCEFPSDDIDDVRDFAVCRLLGMGPGTRTMGAGTLLPPAPAGQKASNTRFSWVSVDALAKAFDERYAGPALSGFLTYPNKRLDRPGTRQQWTVLGDPVFVKAESPLRRGRRPLTAQEREAIEIETLQTEFDRQARNKERKRAQLVKEISVKEALLEALEKV